MEGNVRTFVEFFQRFAYEIFARKKKHQTRDWDYIYKFKIVCIHYYINIFT